mgnify:CR=1 FL=1
MTENEAIRDLQYLIEEYSAYPPETGVSATVGSLQYCISALKEIQQYREIGTVEECREAVEKQKAKKCVEESCPDHTHYKCPSCGKIQKTKYGDSEFGCILNYCSNCGQAIDKNLEGMENERDLL